jgi:exopolysaccharide biosynthesis polyprenyl glycosylphosphotransferase
MTTTETSLQLPRYEAPDLYPDSDDLPEGPAAATGLNTTKLTLALGDLVVITSALLLSIWINRNVNATDPTSAAEYARVVVVSLLVWPIVLTQHLLYRARYLSRGIDEIARVVKAVAVAMLLTGGVSIVLKISVGRQWMIIATTLVLFSLLTSRIAVRALFARMRRRGSMLRTVLIAGRNAEGNLVREMLEADPALGYNFAGFVEDLVESEPGQSPLALLGDPSKVLRAVDETNAVGVIIAATAIDIGTSNRLIRSLTEHGIHVELSSTLCDIAANRLTVRPVGRVPMMYVEPVRRTGWRPQAKRLFDVTVAGAVLVLTFPILMVAGLAIKLTSPGPIFFSQKRIGRDGRPFEMHKLRTMVFDAEDRLDDLLDLNETTGTLFKIKDDPRITRVGQVLRKASLDELPQLLNVIRGEMSLVGPRPALPREVETWGRSLHNRLRVKPGITGMWQVHGRGGDDHDSTYAQLDLYYVDNWTIVTDLAILARTIPVVLSSRGQY